MSVLAKPASCGFAAICCAVMLGIGPRVERARCEEWSPAPAPTRIAIDENGLHLVLEVTPEQDVRLLHFSALPLHEATLGDPAGFGRYRLLELQATGENQNVWGDLLNTGGLDLIDSLLFSLPIFYFLLQFLLPS
jgi:hypothetical protein